MNFQDIVDKNKEQLEILKEMEPFINSVELARQFLQETNWWFFKHAFENPNSATNSTSRDKYNGLREMLINIEGYELKDIIRRIKNIYNNYQIEEALNSIEAEYLKIAEIRKIKNDARKVECYKECNLSLDLIISSYSKLKEVLTYSNSMSADLNRYDESKELKIRLLNENNSIENLIESLSLINSIYNNVNELIGDENEKLKFGRIESGSLMIYIAGCISSLVAMKPILELGYKVYSENFSQKARYELEMKKIELTEKKIKVRGDYWKLITEANENNELKNLAEIDKKKILSNLANLESDISDLYSLNPYIKLDDKELGLKEMKDDVIPIGLLKEYHSEESIKELE